MFGKDIKGIVRDPLIRSTFFSIHFDIQKELSYTNLTSTGFLQEQSSFDKIGRYFFLNFRASENTVHFSIQWRRPSIVYVILHILQT